MQQSVMESSLNPLGTNSSIHERPEGFGLPPQASNFTSHSQTAPFTSQSIFAASKTRRPYSARVPIRSSLDCEFSPITRKRPESAKSFCSERGQINISSNNPTSTFENPHVKEETTLSYDPEISLLSSWREGGASQKVSLDSSYSPFLSNEQGKIKPRPFSARSSDRQYKWQDFDAHSKRKRPESAKQLRMKWALNTEKASRKTYSFVSDKVNSEPLHGTIQHSSFIVQRSQSAETQPRKHIRLENATIKPNLPPETFKGILCQHVLLLKSPL